VARLFGNFVIFSPSFDSEFMPLADEVGRATREATAAHLITQHPGTPWNQPTPTISDQYYDQPYLDLAGVQTGHNAGNREWCAHHAIEWWRLELTHELIRNQPDDVTRRMVLAKSAASDLAVAYLPDNEAIEVDMSVFPAPLTARWFDPVSGRYISVTGSVENQATHRFAPPDKGDWVLLLQRRR
jgi:hypothetical protein